MKVLAVCGSSRSGNTEAMLKKVLDGAKSQGAQIELVLLKDKKIELCDGCMQCEDAKKCVIADEMQQIYPKVFNADAIIFGSPAYFDNVSALMKNFFDRFCPYWEDARLKGKKAFAVCAANCEESLPECVAEIKKFAEICGMNFSGSTTAVASKKKPVVKRDKELQECFEFGRKIGQYK